MPQKETFHLHPSGWENDPAEERFKLGTLDYITYCTYSNYAVFFRMEDEEKNHAIQVLKGGLERTLSQARHLCGSIEKDPAGGYCFSKKRDSTVQFVVQRLDAPGEDHPSFSEIESGHFRTSTLGDLNLWCVSPMTFGVKPEARPENSPVVAAYQANFIRGGLVFIMHHHHYANDMMGWTGLAHQLAENCYAITHQTPFPSWDPACLDVSRLVKGEDIPEESKVDGPPVPERHPDHTKSEYLLFHLPKSKAAELKKLAYPTDGSWISTYDAFSAFLWRTITRLRAPVFNPDLSQPLYWCQAVDMRRRLHNPPMPPRMQHNLVVCAFSWSAPVTPPTAAEVISEWPLPRLASYIRQLTNSVTEEELDKTIAMVAPVRDKSSLCLRMDAYPPLSMLQTDHRDANITEADFGFGVPVAYRHPIACVSENSLLVYPPRKAEGEDEGPEILFAYEKHLKDALIEDPEWTEFFEFRGG
ncbi:hypothetical protein AWENTII_009795 [Aspergillus wentii]